MLARSVAALLVVLCAACTGSGDLEGESLGAKAPGEFLPFDGIYRPGSNPGKVEIAQVAAVRASSESPTLPGAKPSAEIIASLERIAEIERAGSYFPGLALAESGLRENAGDFAGAAVAVYKELSWAYGYGAASGEQVEEGLSNSLALLEDTSFPFDSSRRSGAQAIRGCMAFSRGAWEEAGELLAGILSADEEPDSFLRWMLLVCGLEADTGGTGDEGRAVRSAYGAIRGRYTLFPEYWYRGARAFTAAAVSVEGAARGDDYGNIAAAYAEQCINAGPQGPFAEDCRRILSDHLGLSKEKDIRLKSHSDLRTKAEIENVIRASVSTNDPKKLEELFPLIALPDNPYTLYALGAMQALSSVPEFRTFFAEGARKTAGRLGERLNYISRS